MNCLTNTFFKTLYISPREQQTSEFSNSKLQPFIQYSTAFKQLMMDSTCIMRVNKKIFKNGSGITLGYAFHTADAIRGISADHVLIDEIQDIIMGNVPVIEECLSGSKKQWRTYAGTPKTVNNTLSQKWEQSTQNEWVIKCTACNKWNILGLANIGPLGLICKKCGKAMPATNPGQWVAKKQFGPGVFLAGFRVPQVVSPVVQWDRITEKLANYPTAKFMNEVLAMPYDNSANPLTETDLKNICIPSRENSFEMKSDMGGSNLFLGVDWGHGDISVRARQGGSATGFTVMTLGRYDWDNKFQLLGMKKFTGIESDPEFQVREVARVAKALNVAAVGVDFGGGFMHNAQLRRLLGSDKLIEWQASDNLRVSARWIPEASRMQYNRTECMTDRFVEIKNQQVKFFRWEDFRELSPDFLTICVDYRGDGSRLFYNHILPDDGFHSYLYCKQTADYILGV
jgi:hypothetical protein